MNYLKLYFNKDYNRSKQDLQNNILQVYIIILINRNLRPLAKNQGFRVIYIFRQILCNK